jgi:predicted transglutaminase-like cysteine proteinase
MALRATLVTLIIAILLAGLLSARAGGPPKMIDPNQMEQAVQKYGPLAEKRYQAWQDLVETNWGQPEWTQLNQVNDFFNQVRFIDDSLHWKKSDYWATPIEFLGTDAGDCEDFVIAKYLTLRALGIPDEKLYLTYVKALRLQQAHMVLTYFETPKSIPLVLDNLNRRILKATERQDLVPVYSFNGKGLWLAKQRGKGQAVPGGTAQLKKWHRLLNKLHHE